MGTDELKCPVCESNVSHLGDADFSKSCLEGQGKFIQPSGIRISYFICEECDFCFSPELHSWSLADFENRIYNDQYKLVDPDYEETRPKKQAKNVMETFSNDGPILHLDYGGGTGILAKTLRKSGWNSVSYDPFVNKDLDVTSLGKFDLITAIEVFEHVPDPHKLFRELSGLMNGIVVFTTLLSDGHLFREEGTKWWYIAPRNGHISIFSKKSLEHLVRTYGLNARSSPDGFHILFKKRLPEWADKIKLC